MPSSTSAGSRNVYGVIERFLVIGRSLCLVVRFDAGPPRGGRGAGQREPNLGVRREWLLQELVRVRDSLVEGVLRGDVVEERGLDRSQDDLVDVGLLLDG